jgi:hypothetical protein
MNPYYQYKYSNEFQFVSLANPLLLTMYLEKGIERPKLIGIWKFKKIKTKNK